MHNRIIRVGFLASVVAAPILGCSLAPKSFNHAGLSEATCTRLHEIGLRSVEADGIVGLSIGVALDGEIVFAEGFGHADVNGTRPVTRDTVFDIASVGKHFTSAAILKLYEREQLDISQRARDFVPALPSHFPNATIDQLLRHTSGFASAQTPEMNPPLAYTLPRYGTDLLADVGLQQGRALFGGGETWMYCNAGYLVLGIIIEEASGKRYDHYIREDLLLPNGLSGMFVCERAGPDLMAESIRRNDDGVAAVPFIDMTAYSGQGAICSSVVDLLRWSHALNDGRIISHESLAMMRSSSMVRGLHASHDIHYGMAQRFGAVGDYNWVGHTGGFDGGSAILAYYPAAHLEIAVLSNTRHGGTPHAAAIEAEIARLLLGHVDHHVQPPRQPLSSEQKRAIEGDYADSTNLSARIEDDELIVIREGEEIARLVHIGDLHFRDPRRPEASEYFLMDGDHAGWWVLDLSGHYLSVVRRISHGVGSDQ